MMVKVQSAKETFVSEISAIMLVSVHVHFRTQQKCMVFINLYWKDSRSGGFCKHKSSSFYNQAVEVIYTVICQEAAVTVMPGVAWGTSTCLNCMHRLVRRRLTENSYISTKGCPDYDI